jgi:hypothetical protein
MTKFDHTRKRRINWQFVIPAIIGVLTLGVIAFQAHLLQEANRAARAWVTVTIATLAKPVAVNEKPLVKIDVLNSGKTPALNVKVLGVVSIAANEAGSVNFGDTSTYPTAVIGPTSSITVTLDRPPLGQDEIQAIESGRNGLYAHGLVVYFDIFGRKRRTEFCFSIREKDMHNTPTVLTACEQGNTAD